MILIPFLPETCPRLFKLSVLRLDDVSLIRGLKVVDWDGYRLVNIVGQLTT